jgi:hypothetical protein
LSRWSIFVARLQVVSIHEAITRMEVGRKGAGNTPRCEPVGLR